MELEVKQEESTIDYEYKIYHKDVLLYTANANRTIIPRYRQIHLFDLAGNEVCSLRQEGFMKFVLSNLPLLNWFSQDCPFFMIKAGERIGYFQRLFFRGSRRHHIIGNFRGQNYYFYLLTDNKFSIFCGDKQVGLIKKDSIAYGDGDKFNVLYNSF